MSVFTIYCLAKVENRETFKPQDLSRVHVVNPSYASVAFLPFPGKHATVAKNGDPSAREVSDVIWNEHHRACFMFVLPSLFNWLFTMASFRPGLASTKVGDTNAVGRELKMMEGLCPEFIPTLAAYGVASERGIYTLPGPGSAFDAKSAMNVQVRADLMGMGVVA